MSDSNGSNIFNYDFDWSKLKDNVSNKNTKEICCKKYKKKGEKKCKNCPKRMK